jgi:hypothetical protein
MGNKYFYGHILCLAADIAVVKGLLSQIKISFVLSVLSYINLAD